MREAQRRCASLAAPMGSTIRKESTVVKYTKQSRFCFGVGIVDRGDGPAGERIELFDYTTKNIISIADTVKLINSTIAEGQAAAARPQEVVRHQQR